MVCAGCGCARSDRRIFIEDDELELVENVMGCWVVVNGGGGRINSNSETDDDDRGWPVEFHGELEMFEASDVHRTHTLCPAICYYNEHCTHHSSWIASIQGVTDDSSALEHLRNVCSAVGGFDSSSNFSWADDLWVIERDDDGK